MQQVILSRNLAFLAKLPEPAFSENLDFKDTGAESELRMKILQCNQVILSRNLAFGAKSPEPAFSENLDFKDTCLLYTSPSPRDS